MTTQQHYEFLAKTEDSVVQAINDSGGTAFREGVGNIRGTPTYIYLKENFWFEPSQESFWDQKFTLAATIMRRLQVKRRFACTILGQTGTGKEIFARAFAAGRKFTAINCTAMPAELLESELFGHVVGAFTGAVAAREGLFVSARNGVAFLDEIGDMPELLQAKLLRALQERVVRPVGSNIEVPINCTIICATHQDILKRLRQDIYWRLCTYIIELPNWVERSSEIPWIIREMLDSKKSPLLSSEDIDTIHELFKLKVATGNFRELESLVEQYKLRSFLRKI